MSLSTNSLEVFAEIHFQHEWNLPSAGTKHPLRYWAHVHFEGNPKWGRELWTLFVELEEPPAPRRKSYVAKLFFVAPNAPADFLRSGQTFELCIGSMVKASGIIR